MATVRTSGILGLAREVRSVISILKTTAAKTSSNCSNIVKCAATLDSYNDQIVAGTVINTKEYDGEYVSTFKEYKKWLTSSNDIGLVADKLASLSEEICDTVEKIFAEATNMDEIAEALEQYISSVESTLGDNISETALTAAFGAIGIKGVTKANVATSGEDIKKRNFIDFDKFMKDSNLSSSKLTFEKQEDGSSLIKKDGQSTGYYTTGLAAAFYMKTLKRAIETENATSDTVSTKEQEEEQKKENLDNASAGEEVEELELEDDTTANNYKNGDNDFIQYFDDESNSNDNLTLLSKASTGSDEYSIALFNKGKYTIPEGKSLYIDNKKVATSGDVLNYDDSTNRYSVLTSEGTKKNLSSYTIDKLVTGKIEDTSKNILN